MCEKIFDTINARMFHVKTEHTEAMYLCDQCPTAFISNWNLKQHMEIHSGGKSYICEVCAIMLLFVFFLIIFHFSFYLSLIINVFYFRNAAKDLLGKVA